MVFLFSLNSQLLITINMALTQERAEERAAVIRKGSIRYHFHIALQKGNSYSGYAEITFDLLSVPKELALDFKGQTVARLLQNGEAVEPKVVDGFIFLQVDKLKQGINAIGVHYQNAYRQDVNGCIYQNSYPGHTYVFTNSEPYNANRIFPCFDQPDLKAYFDLSLTFSKDWSHAISNEGSLALKQYTLNEYLFLSTLVYPAEVKQYLSDKSGRMAIFPTTKLLPTYVVFFAVGNFIKIDINQNQKYKAIPMSLYCIEPFYQRLKQRAQFIFNVTVQSMKFYQQFFSYPFPFKKYDQIFLDYGYKSAMQNAGVILFNTYHLQFPVNSKQQMLSFASTISHELSHHWLGNLVTMKWWNDLWLNQGFATYLSYYFISKHQLSIPAIKHPPAMFKFYRNKEQAFEKDYSLSTHPVRAQVRDTKQAATIFDRITYRKGAAIVKQLMFLVGQQSFRKALNQYLHQYAWDNTTTEKFMDVMSQHAKSLSLNTWQVEWLQKCSFNKLSVKWQRQKGMIVIVQSPRQKSQPTLRTHKIKIGLFSGPKKFDVMDIIVPASKDIGVRVDIRKGYKAVVVDVEDHSFVRTQIDPVSLIFFLDNYEHIQDEIILDRVQRQTLKLITKSQKLQHHFLQISLKVFQKVYLQQFINCLYSDQFKQEQLKQYMCWLLSTNNPRRSRLEQQILLRLFEFDQLLMLSQKMKKYNRQSAVLNQVIVKVRHQKSIQQEFSQLKIL